MAYDIRLVKMINGDMVIGKWGEVAGKIKDPVILQTLPTAQGGVQMMLLPFGYPFEQDIDGKLKQEHVMYEYKAVPEELKTKYMEATSNLTLATAGSMKNLDTLADGAGGISNLLRK